LEHTLPVASERLLFLSAREVLYLVEQHKGARRLRLSLSYGADEVQMSIEDDGERDPMLRSSDDPDLPDLAAPSPAIPSTTTDVPTAHATTPILDDLCYRLAQVGGLLELSSPGERGTRVLVRLPYADRATSATVPLPVRPAEPVPDNAPAVRLLLVDSQAVTRAGLHRLLESYPGLDVIGEASDGVQAVSETLELGPQVVLLDAQLPEGQSLEALRQIKQLNLDTHVLLLAAQDREEFFYEALRAGADGYVLKDIAPDELVQAVRTVARGEVLIQSQVAGRLLSRVGRQGRASYESLTTRELEVLRLLARGLRNKEIAARLYVSERTVNFHLANIYQKLNVSGRTEALSKALEQGIITT
ncbi:MAG TPA: LuxR C-terminal-related transcriptional regulator, partial [Ktedonobacteraceae bacterium]|nr:LuxR C-terminal-related transcriptional regulator [Ktedonobacteraceae bacterium]